MQLEPKTVSTLVAELKITRVKAEQVISALVAQKLLKELPGQSEPEFAYVLRVDHFAKEAPK